MRGGASRWDLPKGSHGSGIEIRWMYQCPKLTAGKRDREWRGGYVDEDEKTREERKDDARKKDFLSYPIELKAGGG